MFRHEYIANTPPLVRQAIDKWATQAQKPGDFVCALLQNDLLGAYQRADPWSTKNMAAIVAYLWNEVPSDAWGSVERFEAWPALRLERSKRRGV